MYTIWTRCYGVYIPLHNLEVNIQIYIPLFSYIQLTISFYGSTFSLPFFPSPVFLSIEAKALHFNDSILPDAIPHLNHENFTFGYRNPYLPNLCY
jgi:hypothetical protein